MSDPGFARTEPDPPAPRSRQRGPVAAVQWIVRTPFLAFLCIFGLAFVLRLYAVLELVPVEYILPHTRWETEAIAVSLVQHGTFADPYVLPTGPTAHLPPVFPALLGLIFKIFGLTLTAGYVAWGFRIAVISAMYGLMPWFAGRLGAGRPAGVLGGVVGALVVQWPGHGEALTAIVLGLLMIAFLDRWRAEALPPSRSLILGIGAGAAFHLQPALLPVIAAFLVFELWWRRARRPWAPAALVVLGIVLACVPWGWRNYRVFGEVFFVRSNFGLELRVGNHEGATPAMDGMEVSRPPRHPRSHEDEARLVQQLGEVEYMRHAGRQARTWIREHPGGFLRLTASRFMYFWLGPLYDPIFGVGYVAVLLLAVLGAVRLWPRLTKPERAVLLLPLPAFSLVYYLVAYMPRYRQPIDWILLLLAGAAVWYGLPGRGPRYGVRGSRRRA